MRAPDPASDGFAAGVAGVLIGDFVNSTKTPTATLQRARGVLNDAVEEFRQAIPAVIDGPAFYRGDSWQVATHDPSLALRLAVSMAAALRAADLGVETRMAIGLGRVDGPQTGPVPERMGPAYVLSGRAIDQMGRRRGIELVCGDPYSALSWLPAQAMACSHIVSGWTRRQAQVAHLVLGFGAPQQISLADQLGISQQAVSSIHRSSGVKVVLAILDALESAVAAITPGSDSAAAPD